MAAVFKHLTVTDGFRHYLTTESDIMYRYYTTIGIDIINSDFLNRYIEVYSSKKSDIQTQYSRGRGDTSAATSRTQKSTFVFIIGASLRFWY